MSQSRDILRAAKANDVLVRIAQAGESGKVDGYIVEVGAEIVLLCVVNDQILFDGFRAMLLEDIEEVWSPAPYREFMERALELRGLRRPATPDLDLSSWTTLLTGAGGRFPLVAVHREQTEPDICHIGRVVVASDRTVTLREIAPDATWYERTETYELREITRVDFGGLYEDALAAVNRATRTTGA